MTSTVDIWNSALAALGTRSSVASQSENSAEAQACRLQYDIVLKQSHRAAAWNFCKKYANLALLKAWPGTPENTGAWDGVWSPDLPPPGWLYTYAFPNDCLQLRYIIQTLTNDSVPSPPLMTGMSLANPYRGTRARWERGIDLNDQVPPVQIPTINTNMPQAIACYTVFVPDPNLWDDAFKQVVSDALASQIAMQLVGSKELEVQKIKDANNTILQARVRDGDEGLTIMDNLPDWIAVRGGYPTMNPDVYAAPGLEYGPLFGGL